MSKISSEDLILKQKCQLTNEGGKVWMMSESPKSQESKQSRTKIISAMKAIS